MTTNVEQFAVGVAEYFLWARKSGAYPYGATGSLANGSAAGLSRHKGFAAASLTFPQVPRTTILGDGGKLGEFLGKVVDPTAADVTFSVFDQNFDVALDGRSVYADGDHDAVIFTTACQDFAQLCAVYSVQAQSLASGSLNENGWAIFEIWNFEAAPNLPNLSGTSFEAQNVTYQMSLKEADTELSGLTVSNANYGVTQGTVKFYWSENPVCYHTLVGDGAVNTITLDYTPAADNANKVKAWNDGVAQTYTTDFSVSGTTLTIEAGAVPAAGEVFVVRYEFTADC